MKSEMRIYILQKFLAYDFRAFELCVINSGQQDTNIQETHIFPFAASFFSSLTCLQTNSFIFEKKINKLYLHELIDK